MSGNYVWRERERESDYLLYHYCHDQNEIIKIRRLVKVTIEPETDLSHIALTHNCIKLHSLLTNTHMNPKHHH